jgi:hypothetical protein
MTNIRRTLVLLYVLFVWYALSKPALSQDPIPLEERTTLREKQSKGILGEESPREE